MIPHLKPHRIFSYSSVVSCEINIYIIFKFQVNLLPSHLILFSKLDLIVINSISQVYFIGIATKQIVDQIFKNYLTSNFQTMDLSVSFIDFYFLLIV